MKNTVFLSFMCRYRDRPVTSPLPFFASVHQRDWSFINVTDRSSTWLIVHQRDWSFINVTDRSSTWLIVHQRDYFFNEAWFVTFPIEFNLNFANQNIFTCWKIIAYLNLKGKFLRFLNHITVWGCKKNDPLCVFILKKFKFLR